MKGENKGKLILYNQFLVSGFILLIFVNFNIIIESLNFCFLLFYFAWSVDQQIVNGVS